jgi:hypothetical protein
VRQTRVIYNYVRYRLKGILRSLAREGYNKKLNVPLTAVLNNYLIMCYLINRSCFINATVAAANLIYSIITKKKPYIVNKLRVGLFANKILYKRFN